MQLSPRENFTIVRQIEDHTDSNTYYVQAVIRNAKTDDLLATKNLTDLGSRRFSVVYLVPADVSGQGFYITILTSVYSDSGYTTKSVNYGDKMETYLVQTRFNSVLGVGGGGPDIDYKRIRSIIEEVLSPILPEISKTIKFDVLYEFNQVKKAINGIDIPEMDMMPMMSEIKNQGTNILKEIKSINIPETDLKPLSDTIDSAITIILDEMKQDRETMAKQAEGMTKMIDSSIKTHLEKNTARYNKIMELKKLLDQEMPSKDSEIPELTSMNKMDRINKLMKK